MKRCLLILLLAASLTLTGCSLLNRDYSSIRPHTSSYYESEQRDVLRAESYQDLVNDLMLLVASQDSGGTIWLYPNSDHSDAAEAAERACQEVKQETPLGAYAVDYMTYNVDDSARNYSQITLTISYRRTPEQINAMVHTTSVAALYDLLSAAVHEHAQELVMQVGYYEQQEQQVRDTIAQVRQENHVPDRVIWQVNFYPDASNAGIIEILLNVPEDATAASPDTPA